MAARGLARSSAIATAATAGPQGAQAAGHAGRRATIGRPENGSVLARLAITETTELGATNHMPEPETCLMTLCECHIQF